uniref:DUF834 domain-containing protein n=1 Tax=Oryza barthii TaxID=65489 RepID=A0A0D3EQA1_9ORYZ
MERSVSTTEAGALHGGLRAEDDCRVVEEVGEGGSKVGKRAGAAKGKDVVGVSVEAVAEKEVGRSADVRSGQEWVGLEAVGRREGGTAWRERRRRRRWEIGVAAVVLSVEACEDNIVWLRMRLPKAEMVCLVKESRDVAEKKL